MTGVGNTELTTSEHESLFKSWLSEHHTAVLKVARAYTFTTEECQDLAQEILLQIWRSMPKFQGRSSAATWFYRVALNTALSWQRKEHRRRMRQQPVLEVTDRSAAGTESTEQAAQRELVERLYHAIRQLPNTDAALVLLYLDELSYGQMADVLGISESHVGVKLNRAKKALGQLLQEKSHES